MGAGDSPFQSKAQTREIDGVTYEVLPVPLDQGVPALVRLIKIASPLIGAFASGDIKNVFATLPAVLEIKDVEYYAELFGNSSRYADGDKWVPLKSKPQDFRGLHFAGEYVRFFRWMTFNLEVNFGPFFSGVMGDLGGMMARATPAKSSTSTPGIGLNGA